jgi:hypothetical protein
MLLAIGQRLNRLGRGLIAGTGQSLGIALVLRLLPRFYAMGKRKSDLLGCM